MREQTKTWLTGRRISMNQNKQKNEKKEKKEGKKKIITNNEKQVK